MDLDILGVHTMGMKPNGTIQLAKDSKAICATISASIAQNAETEYMQEKVGL